MKIIQLLNSDGEPIGLYHCPEEVDLETLQTTFNELEDKFVDEDEIHDMIDEELKSTLNVERVFADEIYSNRL